VKGVTDAGLKPHKMGCVAVLGGGLMGSGIATALVLAGVKVQLKEVNQQFLDVSVASLERISDRQRDRQTDRQTAVPAWAASWHCQAHSCSNSLSVCL
jgi:3-hydroxyacyl-CoA dehydrogenase